MSRASNPTSIRVRCRCSCLEAWAFLVSSLPIWLTSKQLSGGGRWDDRFALAVMPGAVLMTLAVILWLIRERQRKLVLSLLLAFSIATQVLIVNRYRLDWQAQRDYYWQLAWRVPGAAAADRDLLV